MVPVDGMQAEVGNGSIGGIGANRICGGSRAEILAGDLSNGTRHIGKAAQASGYSIFMRGITANPAVDNDTGNESFVRA